ncbi:MAG: hypothetical protein V7609_2662 [Verrucomicrobiota bacterium]
MPAASFVNVACICFFGTCALVWGLTSAFYAHIIGLQDQVVRGRLTTFLQKTKLGITDPDQFRLAINQGNLQILQTPDVVEGIKLLRYRIMNGLVFSAILAVLPFGFEILLGGRQQELEVAQSFYRYFCGGSILIDFVIIFWCLSAPARWGVMGMVSEVLHWRDIVSLFPKSAKNGKQE